MAVAAAGSGANLLLMGPGPPRRRARLVTVAGSALQPARGAYEGLPARGADAGHVVVAGQRDLAEGAEHLAALVSNWVRAWKPQMNGLHETPRNSAGVWLVMGSTSCSARVPASRYSAGLCATKSL